MGNACTTPPSGKLSNVKEKVPGWVFAAVIPAGCKNDTWGRHSDGFEITDKFSVQRHRKAQNHTDGCQWGRGFSKGKHVFEVIYPQKQRGAECTVGMATGDASLFHVGKGVMVGGDMKSWGVHIRLKRTYHRGALVKRFPPGATHMPDKFYMYLDSDAGTLGFASDLDYYGTGLSGLPIGEDLYPTFSCCVHNATITVIYRGEGKPGAPANMKVLPAAPRNQLPQVYQPEEEEED